MKIIITIIIVMLVLFAVMCIPIWPKKVKMGLIKVSTFEKIKLMRGTLYMDKTNDIDDEQSKAIPTTEDKINNNLNIRIIYKDKDIPSQAQTSTIPEMQFAEAKKLLSSGSHVYIVFSSPEYPGTPVTLFKIDKDQGSSISQTFSNPNIPFSEQVKVEKVVYKYRVENDGEKGILTFFVKVSSDSKNRLTPIHIGLITKEQWGDMVQLFEVVKNKSGEVSLYWGVDNGLDH